jgi:hypothetical protein
MYGIMGQGLKVVKLSSLSLILVFQILPIGIEYLLYLIQFSDLLFFTTKTGSLHFILFCFQLFVRAFAKDGSSKSILVDEKMMIGQVCSILADKNHVRLNAKLAVIEHMPELYMGRYCMVLSVPDLPIGLTG